MLASQSPRRAELLRRLGLNFEIVPGDIDETYRESESAPAHAERLAREKAVAVAARTTDAYVIGSDTIVVIDGEVLGKPGSAAEAAAMLSRLSDREHIVMTGVAIAHAGQIVSGLEQVRVRVALAPPE